MTKSVFGGMVVLWNLASALSAQGSGAAPFSSERTEQTERAPSQAPSAEQGRTVQVSATQANVRLEPSTTSAVVATPSAGSVLEVIAEADGWLQVRLPKDASGFERVGYIRTALTKPFTAPTSLPPAAVPSLSTSGAGGLSTTIDIASPEKPAQSPETASVTPSGKSTAAILDFDYGTVKQEWSGVVTAKGSTQGIMDVWDVGKGIADLLVDELLQGGEVRLLERKRLGDILKEQDLAKSDRADVSASDAAQLSKLLGARYLVTGSVTKFGGEDSHIGGLGMVAGMFSGVLGGLKLKKTTARVGLSARVIDSSSGEILGSVKAQAESKRRGVLLAGFGGRGGGFGGGGFEMGSSNFQETILGEATMLAVKDAATKLTTALQKLFNAPPP